MFLRIAVVAPLALAAVLPAQVGNTNPLTQSAPAAQVPVKKLSPAEQAAQLQKQKAQLEKEIKYAATRVNNAKALLATKMLRGQPSFKSIDAGKPASAMPMAPQKVQRKYARIGSEQEMNYAGQTVMIKVNDRAISQAKYDAVFNYLRESSSSGKEQLLAQRALFDMIRIEAIASQFIENPGEVQLAENQEKIASGAMTVKQAAIEFGSVQGAIDGAVAITRNSIHGPSFELTAFSTPVGKVSRPFRTMNGYAMLTVKSLEKGETPLRDKVNIDVVQFAYAADPQEMSTAQFKVNSGQTTVLVRDAEVLEILPALFKPPAPRTTERQMLTKQLSELIKQYQDKLEVNPQQAALIQKQIDQLKTRLSDMQREAIKNTRSDATDSPDSDDAKGGKVAPLKKGKVAPLKKGKVAPLKKGKVAPLKKGGE
jgi:hypothetical protein